MLAATLALPAVVYVSTLFPGVGGRVSPGDSAKFQFLSEVLGVAHEPGYPLYVLLGRLWLWLPLPGSLAQRMNLFSAFWGLLAAGLLFWIVLALSRRAWVASLAALAFAFAQAEWMMATEAEVYTMNAALFALTLLAGVRWRQSGGRGWLAVTFAAAGVALGHHPHAVALVPALALLVLLVEPRLLTRPLFAGLVALAGVLLWAPYLHVWIQAQGDPVYLEPVPRGASLWQVLQIPLIRRYRPEAELLGYGAWDLLYVEISRFLFLLNQQFLPVAAALGVLGAREAWRRDRAIAAWVACVGLGAWLLALLFPSDDKPVLYIPAYLVYAILIGLGIDSIRRSSGPLGRIVLVVAVSASLLVHVPVTADFITVEPAGNPYDMRHAIDIADRDAIVVSHYDWRDYHERMVDTYHGIVHDAGARGIEYESMDRVLWDHRYLGPKRLVLAEPDLYHHLVPMHVDLVAESLRGDLEGFVGRVEARQVLVVAGSLPTSGRGRAAIREALEGLGLGEALRPAGSGAYVGVAANLPGRSHHEASGATAVTLTIEGGQPPPGVSPRSWSLTSTARIVLDARAGEEEGSGSLRVGGVELARPAPLMARGRRAPGLHLARLSPGGEVLETGHVDSSRTTTLTPYAHVTARHSPLREIEIVPLPEGFGPERAGFILVAHDDGGDATRVDLYHPVTVLLTDASSSRIKAVVSTDDLQSPVEDELLEVALALAPGDRAAVFVLPPIDPALEEPVRALLWRLGVAAGPALAARRHFVGAGTVGAVPAMRLALSGPPEREGGMASADPPEPLWLDVRADGSWTPRTGGFR